MTPGSDTNHTRPESPLAEGSHTSSRAGARLIAPGHIAPEVLTLLIALLPVAALLAACGGSTVRRISLDQLESAPLAIATDPTRFTVHDPEYMLDAMQPLGPRLGLLLINDADAWQQFQAAVEPLRYMRSSGFDAHDPDFRTQSVVVLLSNAGEAAGSVWPVEISGVRKYEGAGLLLGRFRGATYRPNGLLAGHWLIVERVEALLAVEIDGYFYFPHLPNGMPPNERESDAHFVVRARDDRADAAPLRTE